jgi:hypothetical protein
MTVFLVVSVLSATLSVHRGKSLEAMLNLLANHHKLSAERGVLGLAAFPHLAGIVPTPARALPGSGAAGESACGALMGCALTDVWKG